MPVLALVFVAGVLPVGPRPPQAAAQSGQVLPPLGPPPALSDAEREPVAYEAPAVKQGKPSLPTGRPSDRIQGLREVTDERTDRTSVYEYGGGQHLMQVTMGPQNFRDAQGRWRKIRPGLVRDSGGYRNEEGPTGLFAPDALSGSSPLRFTVGGGTLRVVPAGVSGTPVRASGNAATYADALPSTDLRYHSVASGFVEHVILKERPAADAVAWDVTATDLTLRQEDSGEISILAGDEVVGGVPPVDVFDATAGPNETADSYAGGFERTLADLGDGRYRIEVSFDRTWLDDPDRVYPVTIDPYWEERNRIAYKDTWTRSCAPDNSHASSPKLFVGWSASCGYRSYLDFDTSGYEQEDRVLWSAQMQLYKIHNGTAGNPVKVRRIDTSSEWVDTSVLWGSPLPLDAQIWASTALGGANHGSDASPVGWQTWEMGKLYRYYLDPSFPMQSGDVLGARVDRGVQLEAENYHEFASEDTTIIGGQPILTMFFNDLPDATTPSQPANNAVVTVDSPTLSVAAMPVDDNGDDTWVQFQVSEFADFHENAVTSPWLDLKTWAVPAGSLKDGAVYYWRAVSGDVCDSSGDDVLCTNASPWGGSHPRNTSTSRTFTVSLPHYGSDPRWAMWSEALGNGMTVQVNQATGNLVVDYPVDSLATPSGPLDISLTYNSQLPTSEQVGLGERWKLSAGPLSDGGDIPLQLTELDAAQVGEVIELVYGDGDRHSFSESGTSMFRGSGGVIARDPAATGSQIKWTYRTTSGGYFTFDASGNLKTAKPSSDDYGKPGFDYTFTTQGTWRKLTSVTDPAGRQVTFGYGWYGGRLDTITTWSGNVWNIAYDSFSRLSSITDPSGATVTFGYVGSRTLSGSVISLIKDGSLTGTSDGTEIEYHTNAPDRVQYVTAPGTTASTRFEYGP
ncbi:MAG: DNRLRE domain-containing protein, partial [Actinomycetota bacterium]